MFCAFKRLVFLAMIVCMMASYAQAATDYSGWWWNSANSGTGYSLEVQCDKAYLVWYAYEEGGLNTWYSAILDVDGDTMTGDLYRYDGWPLEPGYDGSGATADEDLGEVTLNFTEDNAGTLTYDPVGTGPTFVRTLERRLIGDSDSRNLDGWWWDSSQQGIGWFFEAKADETNGDVLSVGWYNYRADATRAGGDPRFFITWAEFTPEDTTYTADLIDPMGGQTLTGEYAEPTSSVYDTLNLDIPADFNGDADGASLSFTLGGNSYYLTRFEIPNSCEKCCAPEVTLYDPTGSIQLAYTPLIRARFETPCGSTIDPDTFQMTVDGVAKEPTAIVGEGSQVEFRYQVPHEEAFVWDSEHTFWVYVEDECGMETEFEWSFYIPFGDY